MAVGAAGRLVIGGDTTSGDFPATPGAFDTGHNGLTDLTALVFDLPQVRADISASPDIGTLPFTAQFTVSLTNFREQTRRVSGRIDIETAGGGFFPTWRAGFTNIQGQGVFTATWPQNLPGLGSLQGINTFTLSAEDVTPAPWNQPPYAPSGDRSEDSCTVTGL